MRRYFLSPFCINLFVFAFTPQSAFAAEEQSENWKVTQNDYVTCVASKADELTPLGGSALEVSEIATGYCASVAEGFRTEFSIYLRAKMSGADARDMAETGSAKSAEELRIRTKAAVAERVLRARSSK